MRYALRVAVGVAKAEHRRHAWPVQDIVDVGATSLQGLVLLGCIGRGQPGAGIDTCGRIARCGQLVPELDFDLIRSNPKPFVGASDVTVLHAAIRRFCGLTTFYG
ncbi:MAG: LD-carboxypeptidase, partial [Acidimicrobiales bacterium]